MTTTDMPGDTADLGERAGVERDPGRRASGRRGGRRRVAGGRRLLAVVVAIVLVVAAGLLAYLSPLMSVRSIDVHGTAVLDPARIAADSGIARGTPLLQVDTAPAAARIAAEPRVRSVRVTRSYPSAIDITVTERVAVAFRTAEGAAHLYDVDGVDFARQPQNPRLPRLTADDPSTNTAATRAALAVVAGLPASLHARVIEVSADGPADVRLRLAGGATVIWGDAEQLAAKSRTLSYLLTRQGTEYNVSAPQYPTFR